MVPTGRLVVVTVGAERASIVPPKLELVPTATQFTGLPHETPSREPTPDGALVGLQLDPLLDVLMMVVPPTATQDVVVMQPMPTSVVVPVCAPRSDHVVPPSVVWTT
ncbi:MAG TPA: hypothetical protein VGG09_15280 [Acidimicrobiales bacterium]|jgi:hypothetical protein